MRRRLPWWAGGSTRKVLLTAHVGDVRTVPFFASRLGKKVSRGFKGSADLLPLANTARFPQGWHFHLPRQRG
jgi:hypothetical protein